MDRPDIVERGRAYIQRGVALAAVAAGARELPDGPYRHQLLQLQRAHAVALGAEFRENGAHDEDVRLFLGAYDAARARALTLPAEGGVVALRSHFSPTEIVTIEASVPAIPGAFEKVNLSLAEIMASASPTAIDASSRSDPR